MVRTRGWSTKNPYITNAGRTKSQPMKASRRTTLAKEIRREAGGVRVVNSDRAAISGSVVSRLLLGKLLLVLRLDGLQQPGGILLATHHLLELGCPSLSE